MVIDTIQKYMKGSNAVNLADAIERGIFDGSLRDGDKLPAIRVLAQKLSVSPSTVSSAYKQLSQRGFLVTDGRRGTRIYFDDGAQAVQTAQAYDLRDLAIGSPDPELLPDLQGSLSSLQIKKRLYDEPLNHGPLEKWCRTWFEKDGLEVHSIDMVGGAMDGIERVLRAGLRFGDSIAVEDPGFSGVIGLLRSMGFPIIPVEIDEKGLLPSALNAALEKGIKGIILTPRAQNPMGSAMDKKRAQTLRECLKDHPNVLIIEDDHASLVSGAPAHTLCQGIPNPWVVIRSFSKALGPDLRLAAMTGERRLMARVQAGQRVGMRWVSSILQSLAHHLLLNADVQRTLEHATGTYAARRNALVRALKSYGIKSTAVSGLNVWVPVSDEARVVQGCAVAGFAISAGAAYRLKSEPAVRITVSALEEGEAEQVASIVARALALKAHSSPA